MPLELLTAANAIASIVTFVLFRSEARMRTRQFVKVSKLLVATDKRMDASDLKYRTITADFTAVQWLAVFKKQVNIVREASELAGKAGLAEDAARLSKSADQLNDAWEDLKALNPP